MMLTVVISYYKALDNLKLILRALNNQSSMDFEVIISEDDNNPETIDFLSANKAKYHFKILHINQPKDDGFRKNEMLNKAILTSNADMLVFIDGDCVPHRHFIKNYQQHLAEGYICEGRSVMLGEDISKEIKQTLTLDKLNIVSLVASDSENIKEGIYFPFFPLSNNMKGRGLLGRNWRIFKKHLIAVNGFDMDYVKAGVGEDVDIEWRLKASGLKSKSLKNKAIVYHIFHPRGYSDEAVVFNYNLFAEKQKLNHIKCKNGLEQLGTI